MKQQLLTALFLLVASVATSSADAHGRHGHHSHHGDAFVSYTGTLVLSMVYGGTTSPLLAGTTLGAASVILTNDEMRAHQQVAAKLLVQDVQDFYLTGSTSLNLQSSINGLRSEFPDLSDSEAVDVLTQSAELILQ